MIRAFAILAALALAGCQTPFDPCPEGFSLSYERHFGDANGHMNGGFSGVEDGDEELVGSYGNRIRQDVRVNTVGVAAHFSFADVRTCPVFGGSQD